MLQYMTSCIWGCMSHATKRVFLKIIQGGNTIGHAFPLIMYTILPIGYTMLPIGYTMMFVILDVLRSFLYGTFIDMTKYLSTHVALVSGMGTPKFFRGWQ